MPSRSVHFLGSSFGSREEGAAFARFLRGILGLTPEQCYARPMVIPGEPTTSQTSIDCAAHWTQIVIPARVERRAEELQRAWTTSQNWEGDARYAAQVEARDESPAEIERLRAGHFEVVGLTAEQRRFLEAAREGKASGWDFGSSAVALMKRASYVRGVKKGRATVYEITPEGARILEARAV